MNIPENGLLFEAATIVVKFASKLWVAGTIVVNSQEIKNELIAEYNSLNPNELLVDPDNHFLGCNLIVDTSQKELIKGLGIDGKTLEEVDSFKKDN